MANENQYYKYPFAENGNADEVPDQGSGGVVDYESGYGPDYEKAVGVEGRKRIDRTSFNGLFNGATKNIKQHQEHNWPTWIEDDGSSDPAVPFSYDAGVVVYHNGQAWVSLLDSNIDEPTISSAKWKIYSIEYATEDQAENLSDDNSIMTPSVIPHTFLPSSVLSSTQSVRLPNGLIMKFGIFVESSNASDIKYWNDPFPGGVLSMTVTPNIILPTSGGGIVTSYDKSSFTFTAGDSYGNSTPAFVQAIGY